MYLLTPTIVGVILVDKISMERHFMHRKVVEEIQLRLKAPAIALERIAEGRHLPKIFADVALDELKKARKLTDKLEKQKKG